MHTLRNMHHKLNVVEYFSMSQRSNFELVKGLIEDFEANKISEEMALSEVNKISATDLDEYSLRNYWRSMDLDTLAETLTMPHISDWQELNDDRSLELIREAIANLDRDALFTRNTTALEKRYSKPEGTFNGWIFHEDIVDDNEILEKLKVDTTLYL